MSYNPEKHNFICGMTGGGKTTFASKVYEELPTLCVFINTNLERIPEQKSDIIVNDVDQVIEAINEGYTKICFNPKANKDIEAEEIDEIRQVLMNMGLTANRAKSKPIVIAHLFIDEIQDYSSLHKPHKGIDRLWKRGRRYGVTGIAISQRPADVSHTILTQSAYHVIFKLGTYEIPYFQKYKIPIDEHIEWLKQDYHFVVWDGTEIERFRPIEI